MVLTFWNNCKLGVKLHLAFALVMLVFVAALAGVFVLYAKVEALTNLQNTTIVPARSVANRLALAIERTESLGAYYVAERHSAIAARYLAQYRQTVAIYRSTFAEAAKFADSDLQRAMVADIRTVADGPKGWLQGNEDAFALKAAGRFDAASDLYFDSVADGMNPWRRGTCPKWAPYCRRRPAEM